MKKTLLSIAFAAASVPFVWAQTPADNSGQTTPPDQTTTPSTTTDTTPSATNSDNPGTTNGTPANRSNLPSTASPFPSIGLFGLVSVGGYFVLRSTRPRTES